MKKHYDVVVIGGGPAGMAAALSADSEGASVLIIETDDMPGGILSQCIHNGFGLHIFKEELTGPEYADRFMKLLAQSGVDMALGTIMLDVTPDRVVTAVGKLHGLFSVSAGAVVFAMGARERPRGAISLPGTRPAGVMTAGVAQKYVNIQGFLPGKECVILGSGDIGLIMARRMTLEGAKVAAVVELMPYSSGLARNIKQCLEDFDIPLMLSHTVVNIHGRDRLSGVDISAVDENGQPVGEVTHIPCDLLMLSVGLIPAADKLLTLGATPQPGSNSVKVGANYESSVEGMFACGNMLHIHDLVDNVTAESEIAGRHAARFALKGKVQKEEFAVAHCPEISYTVPATISKDTDVKLYFRVKRVFKNATLHITCGDKLIYKAKKRIMTPGEMCDVMLPAKALADVNGEVFVSVKLKV